MNKITNKNEAKTRTEHISCECKCKFNSTTCNSNQGWNNKHVNMNAVKAKNIVVGILSHAFVRIVSIFKSVADTSVAEYDEIVIVMDLVSIKTNTIATNVMSTASIK